MKLGLHLGVPMSEYLAVDAVSASLLHAFRPTPLHARAYMTQPREDTSALMVGEAAHYAALEPKLFPDRYHLPPDVDRRTKDGKAAWAAFVDAHPTGVALKLDEYDRARAISAAVWAHVEASRYLSGQGLNEVTVYHDADGTLCKIRPDRLTSVDEFSWVVDVKTCRSAGAHAFAKAVYDYGYHMKAAFYLDVLNALSPMDRRFLFIAVENTAPHAVALYELTDEAIGQGREECASALATYKECKASGIWPGFPTPVQYLDLPKWAQRVMA